jgi:hypothetical protein
MIDYILANKEWIFSGVGVSALSVLFFFFHRLKSTHSPTIQSASVPATQPVNASTPQPVSAVVTSKTADPMSKQMLYLSDIARIKNGEYFILPKLDPHSDSSARITLKEIENSEKSNPRARLHVDLGGAIVLCGPGVEKVATNEFLLPACAGSASDEENFSAFSFFTTFPTAFIFFRVFVSHINVHAGEIEINFVQVRSVWR